MTKKKKKTRLAKRGGEENREKEREGRKRESLACSRLKGKGREEKASGLFVLIMQTSDGIGDAKESRPAHLRSPPPLEKYGKKLGAKKK